MSLGRKATDLLEMAGLPSFTINIIDSPFLQVLQSTYSPNNLISLSFLTTFLYSIYLKFITLNIGILPLLR